MGFVPSRKNAKMIENVVVFLFRRRPKQERSPSISSEINHKVVQIYPDLMTDLVQTLQTCVSHKSRRCFLAKKNKVHLSHSWFQLAALANIFSISQSFKSAICSWEASDPRYHWASYRYPPSTAGRGEGKEGTWNRNF